MFANRCHEPPPALIAVCRESRALVHCRYKRLKLHHTVKYIDLDHDVLLLESYLLVRRLLKTLRFLALIPLLRDRTRHLALGTSFGYHVGLCHPILSNKVSKRNKTLFLERIARLPRLKKLLFFVHQEFQFHDPWLSSHRPMLLHHSWSPKLYTQFGISPSYPRYFHQNCFQYYPIRVDDVVGDETSMMNWDAEEEEDEEEEEKWRCCRPSNEDWRRFKRRFLKAMSVMLDKDSWSSHPALRIEGASLQWVYRRGYVQ